jgi:hypothetical protein
MWAFSFKADLPPCHSVQLPACLSGKKQLCYSPAVLLLFMHEMLLLLILSLSMPLSHLLLLSVAASSVNVTALPADWGPNAQDDSYSFKVRVGEPFHRYLQVLANDWPGKPHIKITEIPDKDTYGHVSMADTYLAYDIAKYDGSNVTDTFW